MTSLQVAHKRSLHTPIYKKSKFSFADIDRLVIHLSDCIKVIPTDKIEFIQASSNYSVIHMTDGSKLVTSKTLKNVSESLGNHFIRTHKSFVVNVKYIAEYKFREGQLLMSSDKIVLVSRANKVILKEIFN